jgi:polyvinyl alcohol dehydrogenase (cytochrome)
MGAIAERTATDRREHGRISLARVAALLFAVGALALPPSAMADWPIYGHDLANSRDAGSEGPSPSQLGSISRAWTFSTPTGDFTGTPVISRGVLVAGTNGGWIFALDAVSGRVLWSRDIGQPINGTAAIDPHAPHGAAVFVPIAQLGGPRLLALSLRNGETRWDTTLTTQASSTVFGSPVYWRHSLYIGTSGPSDDNSTARGSVVAVDEKNGTIRWQTFMVPADRDGAAVWSTPAIDTKARRLYVGTGNNYHPPTTSSEDSMMALDTGTGQIVGQFQATANDSFSIPGNLTGSDFDFGASPNLFTGPDGEELVGEGQKSGIYWALDRTTMQPVWHNMVGPGGILGGILGSTAFDGTRIYGADTLSGQVFALGRDGSTQWNSLDGRVLHLSPATIANGVLYTVDPTGFLTARDPATGAVLAKPSLGARSAGGVSAAGGAVYVAVGTSQGSSGSIIAFGDTSH